MSVQVFFDLSAGLARTVVVPAGTLASCVAHVLDVERRLGLRAERYLENPACWGRRDFALVGDDDALCVVVSAHNRWVVDLWRDLGAWCAKAPEGETEELTPEGAATFWHGLERIDLPQERWSADYYRERMEHVYEVLRGREDEGVSLDAPALSARQAGAVVRIFEQFINTHGHDLEVVRGEDALRSRLHGEYEWCEKCGAVDPDLVERCRKRKCPVRAERRENGDGR